MPPATVEKKAAEPKTEGRAAPAAKTKRYKFRLLRGQYVSTEWKIVTDPETGLRNRVPVNTTYQADPRKGVFPIIETDEDLEEYNGQYAHMKKFERIIGSATQTVTDPTQRLEGESLNAYLRRMEDLAKGVRARVETTLKSLDRLTQEELVALAAQEEIDLSSCKSLEEVRKTIRDALQS